MDWLPLTLICAFSLASTDAATKHWLRTYSARELSLVRLAVTGMIMSPLLADLGNLTDLPMTFWFWLAALVPFEIAAMVLYMRAIRDHPLSLTLPYLAFTPVFVILSGYLLLGERVSARGALGILLVVAGAWVLNVERADRRNWRSWGAPLLAIFHEPGSRLMLIVAVLYSLTSVMGKGAMRYMDPLHFGAFYFVILGVAALLLFALPNPGILVTVWRRPWAVLVIALLNAIMIYTHFLALQRVEVAYMIAVKRTSLLFGILYGALVFREQRLGVHLFAGTIMVAGVSLIALAS